MSESQEASLYYWYHIIADVAYYTTVAFARVAKIVNFMCGYWQILLVLLFVCILACLVQAYQMYKWYKSLTIENVVSKIIEAKEKKKAKEGKNN